MGGNGTVKEKSSSAWSTKKGLDVAGGLGGLSSVAGISKAKAEEDVPTI